MLHIWVVNCDIYFRQPDVPIYAGKAVCNFKELVIIFFTVNFESSGYACASNGLYQFKNSKSFVVAGNQNKW